MIVFVAEHNSNTIAQLLKRINITVLHHNQPEAVQQPNPQFNFSILERVDALILEITQSTQEIHYLLAQAIILQKPTLCLYPKNQEPREILIQLSKKNIPRSIITRSYQLGGVDQVVEKFLRTIDHSISVEENTNIKFTLRLTPTLLHYLDWLERHEQVNKAELLRRLLRYRLEHDEAYQQFLKHQE
jgi:hypothetical protein